MKCSKTILASILAAAMIVPSVGVTAFAANDNTTSDTTKVTYEVTQSYNWTVPATITFDSNKGINKTDAKAGEVSVSKNIIPDGQMLHITLDSSNTFELKNKNTTLTYTVTADSKVLNAGDTVLDVNAGTNTGSKTLTFTLSTVKTGAEVAGTYEGTVTYAAEVTNQASN